MMGKALLSRSRVTTNDNSARDQIPDRSFSQCRSTCVSPSLTQKGLRPPRCNKHEYSKKQRS